MPRNKLENMNWSWREKEECPEEHLWPENINYLVYHQSISNLKLTKLELTIMLSETNTLNINNSLTNN